MSEKTPTKSNHVLPLKVYFGVAIALFFFTGLTVLVAQYQFGEWNVIVALLIACIKGSLVALFFMHLKYDNKLYGTILILSLVFLAIFIGLTMIDTMYRGEIDPAEKTVINKEAVIYDQNKNK